MPRKTWHKAHSDLLVELALFQALHEIAQRRADALVECVESNADDALPELLEAVERVSKHITNTADNIVKEVACDFIDRAELVALAAKQAFREGPNPKNYVVTALGSAYKLVTVDYFGFSHFVEAEQFINIFQSVRDNNPEPIEQATKVFEASYHAALKNQNNSERDLNKESAYKAELFKALHSYAIAVYTTMTNENSVTTRAAILLATSDLVELVRRYVKGASIQVELVLELQQLLSQ